MFRFPGQNIGKCLYLLTCVHDVSFWCEGDDNIDEARLKEIVIRETENMVESVSCIDTFQPDDSSNRVSYCYRMMYSSKHEN